MDEQKQKAILRQTFDSVSGGYDDPALRFFQRSAEHMVSLAGLHGDERVLDVATGTGNVALALAEKLPRGHVTGIDFSPGMLERARQKAAERGIGNADFIEADMQDHELAGDPFDIAVCAFGIFFVENMELQLSRIAAAVKPGGRVIICNFQEDYFSPLKEIFFTRLNKDFGVAKPPDTWKRIASEEGCRRLFEQAGLVNVSVEAKNMGYFLTSAEQWWAVVWNGGLRRMVSGLSHEDQETFRRQHLEEVAALATDRGIRLDVGVLYTTGTKL